MDVIKNTLESFIGTFDDPGDYPSGAGAGPMPSYQYVEAINGHLIITIDRDAITDWVGKDVRVTCTILKDFINSGRDELADEAPSGVDEIKSWNVDCAERSVLARMYDICPAFYWITAVIVALGALIIFLPSDILQEAAVIIVVFIGAWLAGKGGEYTVTISPEEFVADDHIDTSYDDYDYDPADFHGWDDDDDS